MAPSRDAPDAGLTWRMLATAGLVALVYAAAVLPAFLLGPVWGAVAVAAAVACAVVSVRAADRLVLYAMDARPVTSDEEPELHAVLDRLCMSSGLPKPRLAVSALEAPNAFAAGSGPGSAVVCVTGGLRPRLLPGELAAVLAHEVAHVANRDVLVGAVAAFPGLCAGLFLGWWTGLLTGRDRHGAGRAAAFAGGVVLLPLGVAAAVLYGVGTLVGLALSRHRELCADATGALLIGRPSDLVSALEKITEGLRDASRDDLRALRPVRALCVVGAHGGGAAGLLSSHPPLERRRERLSVLSWRLASGG
ncbi:zinc metalloprotease HtpX [Actinomadura sp. GC306]|uniref:M48 family metalloprotease n=1 Tax=Actinomadura sp. GC306 TaxID=2530367 RepID=UPI00104EF130|nr:M48 family metalloprotease [Actinomadura sp. GC306]TDC62285.1 zinc metalloprotease HtpX [Actinomadura sp. GC306]